MIGGVERPTSGKVYIDGKDIFKFNDDKLQDELDSYLTVGKPILKNDNLINNNGYFYYNKE